MNIFVSYSYRPDNRWVDELVIPLIEWFGHKAITGRILDGGALNDEIQSKLRQCRRVVCFVTRAAERRDEQGRVVGYDPPDWVRDELIMGRSSGHLATEYREMGVRYGGASASHPYAEFDRSRLPDLLLDLARRVATWPVGPLQLRLAVPEALRSEVELAAKEGRLRARWVAFDESGTELGAEDASVRLRDERLMLPLWIKPDPNLSLDIELKMGASRLACQGLNPSVCEARLFAM